MAVQHNVLTDTEGLRRTFEVSLDLLVRGQFLLVFPEDPTEPLDPHFKMSPFKKGFVRLGDSFFERTGQILPFYPLAIHAGRRVVQVGIPIMYNPYNSAIMERIRIKNVLEGMIHEMYLKMETGLYISVPLPR